MANKYPRLGRQWTKPFDDFMGSAVGNTPIDSYIYVDPVAGLDSNPGTQAKPLLNIETALALIPVSPRRKNRVVLLPGTHTFQNPDALITAPWAPQSSPRDASGRAEPLALVGSFTNEVGVRTITTASGTGVVVTDSTLSMTTDQYFGAWIRFITGAATGQRRLCFANSATTLTPNAPFAAIGIGDTFVVEKNAVTVTWPGDMLLLGAQINMIGIKWLAPTSAASGFSGRFLIGAGTAVNAEACTWDMVNNKNWLMPAGSVCNCQSEQTTTGVNSTDPIFNTALRFSAGCTILNAAMGQSQSQLRGHLALSNVDGLTNSFALGSQTQLATLAAKNFSATVILGAVFRVAPISAMPGFIHGPHSSGGTSPLMAAFSNAVIRLDFMDLSTSGGDGIQAQEGGVIDLQRVTGTGNAGKGATAANGGQVFLRTSGGNAQATVTGTGGDTAAGALVKSYASINGTAGYSETLLNGPTGNKVTLQNNTSLVDSVKGTATLVGGTVTVSAVALSATAVIQLTRNTPGGTAGNLSAPSASRVPGSSGSFVINSDSGTDTSTVDWRITN